jgi:hypothetical protein
MGLQHQPKLGTAVTINDIEVAEGGTKALVVPETLPWCGIECLRACLRSR